jgi:hypothetical protein
MYVAMRRFFIPDRDAPRGPEGVANQLQQHEEMRWSERALPEGGKGMMAKRIGLIALGLVLVAAVSGAPALKAADDVSNQSFDVGMWLGDGMSGSAPSVEQSAILLAEQEALIAEREALMGEPSALPRDLIEEDFSLVLAPAPQAQLLAAAHQAP